MICHFYDIMHINTLLIEERQPKNVSVRESNTTVYEFKNTRPIWARGQAISRIGNMQYEICYIISTERHNTTLNHSWLSRVHALPYQSALQCLKSKTSNAITLYPHDGRVRCKAKIPPSISAGRDEEYRLVIAASSPNKCTDDHSANY